MVFGGVAVTVAPVCPSDHLTVPSQPVAYKVIVLPAHIVFVTQEIVGTDGNVIVTDTLFDSGLLQVPCLQTAEYVVVEFTVSVIVAPVLLFDHKTVPDAHPIAVNVTEPPAQTLSGTDVIVGASGVPTFTVTGSDVFASPHPSTVHFTEYIVVIVGLTVMLVVVTPLLHNKVPLQLLAVKVTSAPAQICVLVEVIFGVVAAGNTVTFTLAEASVAQATPVQVAV